MLQFLKSRPEFEDAGSDMPGSVWARYRNGEIFVFVNDDMVEAEDVAVSKSALRNASHSLSSTTQTPASAQTAPIHRSAANAIQLPANSKVMLFDNIGTLGAIPAPANFANPFIRANVDASINQIQNETRPQKYNVTFQDGTPANLKSVTNADVLYIYCHGGLGVDRSKKPIFVINTSLPVVSGITISDLQNYNALGADLQAGDVGSMMVIERVVNGQSALVPKTYYYITPSFVTRNMSFNPNSLVVINGCAANADIGAAFRTAFTGKGASAFGSWDGEANGLDALETGEELITGLLGTSTQRPFAWPAILTALQKSKRKAKPYPISLSYDAVNKPMTHTPPDPALPNGKTKGGYTQFSIKPTGDLFGLLDPTLAYISVSEANSQLTLIGVFGDDPGASDRSVTVQGTSLNVTSWDAGGVITCDLPVSGTGAAGPVVVTVKGHASNPVMLTEWRGTLHADVHGQGSLLLSEDFALHFRADVQSIRLNPREDPVQPTTLQTTFAPAADSTNTYQASGAYVQTSGDGGVFTTTWAGKGQVPLYKLKVTSPTMAFNYFGNVDVASKVINFGVVSTVDSAYKSTYTTPTGTSAITAGAVLDAGTLGLQGVSSTSSFLTFPLDANFNITAGSQTFSDAHLAVTGGDISATLSWKFSPVNFPPDPTTARGVTRQRTAQARR